MTGKTITVPAGGSLQAAIDEAQFGDTILLQPGATYTGNFVLKTKVGTGWIVIRTASPDGVLPQLGNRVGPQNAPVMAKIITPNGVAAISSDVGANHYRLVGLEVTVAPVTSAGVPNMIFFENTSMYAATTAMPTDMIVDRCYVHGNPSAQLTRRGVAMMGARMAVIDSYISEMHDTADSQAVAGWGGPGPYKIVNNYLEGAAENIFFFGYDNMPVEMIPSDIEIRGNYVRKPLKWKADDPSFAGVRWPIKNLMEFKTARRALIEGNIFENNWMGADQQGFGIVISCNGDAGANCRNEDITFSNNIVRNSTAGMSIVGFNFTGSLDRVLVRNNVFENIPTVLMQVMIRANEVTIEHNTAFNGSHALFVGGEADQDFAFRNNIANYAAYGMYVNYMGPGAANLEVMTPPAATLDTRITNNVLVNNLGLSSFATNPGTTWYPKLDAVGFVNAAAGNYRLTQTSPYKNAGTDGADVGVDMDALMVATRNSLSGAAAGGTSPVDSTPPVISSVNAGSITSTGATIAWTTSELADAQVEYGATMAYGSMSTAATALTTAHTITLTGLQPSTVYQLRVRSKDAAGNLAVSGNASFTTTAAQPAAFRPIRVNAGGPAYTDAAGQRWSADTGYVSGIAYSTTVPIANTTTAPLYQTHRWNYGTMQYRFTVPNGTYTVNLKFADPTFTTAGRRVFNIVLNGQTVQANFDPIAAAGAALTAVDRAYTVNVSNGQIAIDLTAVVNNPEVNAIEITAGTQSPKSSVAIRVNAGGAAYTDAAGQAWSADTGYVSGIAYNTTTPIANTNTAPLYQTHRWNYGSLQYRFTVPNGTYTVKLKFADPTFRAAGQRVFNIVLNGQTVEAKFDPIAAAGAAFTAVDHAYTVTVTNGQITIDLTAVVDNPAVNAIEITG